MTRATARTRPSTPWAAGRSLDRRPLDRDLETEVCVVGGGIAGLSVAHRLSRRGVAVTVLESLSLGAGDTGATTAHLASALDDRFSDLEDRHGAGGARLAYESHQAAIEEIEATVRAERIECDFARLDGWLFPAPGESPDLLDREGEAARRAGFHDVERHEWIPGVPFGSGPCLRFPRQGRFEPLRYLAGLAEAVERAGGRIFTGTRVESIGRGSVPTAQTAGGPTVAAERLVVATNAPIHDRILVSSRQEAYRTYAVACPVARGAVADALYWDTGDPYHYVRLQPRGGGDGRDLLIVGGEDHRTGEGPDGEEPWERLEAWARERFGAAGASHRWSGQVLEPIDDLAYIGRDLVDRDRLFVATGDSGHGITHGTIAGILISALILDGDHPWAALYDPWRIRLAATGDFLAAGLHVGSKYLEWLAGSPEEARSVEEIPAGAGRVVRLGGCPAAVHRDDAGTLHARSAVCPHLGCIVHWNDVERTWDCPCHGSRFAPGGEVIHGPAATGLAELRGRGAR